MEHKFEQKVYYADTDAYGVVWHGAYLRWLEMGRVMWCEKTGNNLIDLKNNDILLPVTNINVRYKASARLNDDVVITTKIEKFNGFCVTFKQQVLSKETGKMFIDASVDVVAIHEGVKHWHGATKDSWFSHIAITKGESEWCEPVSDEEYDQLDK